MFVLEYGSAPLGTRVLAQPWSVFNVPKVWGVYLLKIDVPESRHYHVSVMSLASVGWIYTVLAISFRFLDVPFPISYKILQSFFGVDSLLINHMLIIPFLGFKQRRNIPFNVHLIIRIFSIIWIGCEVLRVFSSKNFLVLLMEIILLIFNARISLLDEPVLTC